MNISGNIEKVLHLFGNLMFYFECGFVSPDVILLNTKYTIKYVCIYCGVLFYLIKIGMSI